MTRYRLTAALIMAGFAGVQSVLAAEPALVDGRISAVTVFQGQALVTRDVELPETQGLLEVVVGNLPESVLPNSLYAEPDGGLQIRSVRFRARPIEGDVREEVRELDEQIQAIDDKLNALAQERQLLTQRRPYLQQLSQFMAFTSQRELQHGVLNAETLKVLTQFLFAENERIMDRELEINVEERTHRKERELLDRQRATMAAGSSRTVREAVVFVNAPQAMAARFKLSYLVGNANWSPSYNLRATEDRGQVTLEYNASIEQMSGEDWNDVEMVLSTATPSLVAKAPRLSPLAIKLGALEQVQQQQPRSAAANYQQAKQNLAQLDKMRASSANVSSPSEDASQVALGGAMGGFGSGASGGEALSRRGLGSWGFQSSNTASADEGLNRFACELQLLDFNSALSELKSERDRAEKPAEGVSVSYRLANRTSLPSRSDRQLIQIAALPLEGDFYRLATPVLTNFVYEEARLTNSSDKVFLAGPVATFVGGQFVGHGELPTVTAGESFTVGLGIDPLLRAHRELVKKEERVQGGNRVVDFTYEILLENFGNTPTPVRILDRLPIVGENDIKVTLAKSDEQVSADESYQMTDRKNGILRWDVEVPAQAIGTKQKRLQYTMQIEYDKQLSIVGMPAQR